MFGKLCYLCKKYSVTHSPGPSNFLQVFGVFMNISKSYNKTLLTCNNEYERVEIKRLSILSKTYNNIKRIMADQQCFHSSGQFLSIDSNKRWFVGKQHCLRDRKGAFSLHAFLPKL